MSLAAREAVRQFQSTLPRGERPGPFFGVYPSLVFQSTLPRGERLYTIKYVIISNLIVPFLRMAYVCRSCFLN